MNDQWSLCKVDIRVIGYIFLFVCVGQEEKVGFIVQRRVGWKFDFVVILWVVIFGRKSYFIFFRGI